MGPDRRWPGAAALIITHPFHTKTTFVDFSVRDSFLIVFVGQHVQPLFRPFAGVVAFTVFAPTMGALAATALIIEVLAAKAMHLLCPAAPKAKATKACHYHAL